MPARLCAESRERHASKAKLSLTSHVSSSKGLSNLTTFFVPSTHMGSLLPHKRICNFKISQLKCFWQFPWFCLGLVILAVPNGSPWMDGGRCAKSPLRAFSLDFFSPTFLDRETSCWFVKRRLINCSLSCRIAWFLKKLTKDLFFSGFKYFVFGAHFQAIKMSCRHRTV